MVDNILMTQKYCDKCDHFKTLEEFNIYVENFLNTIESSPIAYKKKVIDDIKLIQQIIENNFIKKNKLCQKLSKIIPTILFIILNPQYDTLEKYEECLNKNIAHLPIEQLLSLFHDFPCQG
jgi:DNA-binding phage protein